MSRAAVSHLARALRRGGALLDRAAVFLDELIDGKQRAPVSPAQHDRPAPVRIPPDAAAMLAGLDKALEVKTITPPSEPLEGSAAWRRARRAS